MVKVVCTFCSHEQNTKTKLERVTCSSCGKKFPNTISKKNIEVKTPEPSNNNNKEEETFVDKFDKETDDLTKKVLLD